MRLLSLVAVLALFVVPVGATEIDDAAADIVGAWQLDFTTPEYEHRTPVVLVGRQQQELVAWAVEDGEPEKFESVRLQDETLILIIKPKEHDGQLKVTMKAQLKAEGACQGEAKYNHTDGDTGSFDFTGKKLTADDFDSAAQWKLSFTSPDDQPRNPVVTVVTDGGKHYGWYSSDEYELPMMDVSNSNGRIQMSVSAKTYEGTVDVTFRGTINDETIKGDAQYEMESESGSFPFTGKKHS